MLYFFSVLFLFLTACSGGDVGVSSMGLAIPAASISQGGQESLFVKVNSSTHHAKFQIECDKYSKRVELSYDGSSWQKISAIQCRSGLSTVDFNVDHEGSYATWPKVSAKLRVVSDRGTGEEKSVYFVFGSALVSEQQISAATFPGGFVNSTIIGLSLNSKFSFDTADNSATYAASEMFLTSDATCQTGGNWVPYSEEAEFVITQLNAANSINVKFRDSGENESSCYSTTVVHDNVGPTISSFTVSTLGGLINQSTFDFTALGSGDFFEMAVSPNSVCAGGTWQSVNLAKTGESVPSLNSFNSVSLQFRDQAHNLSNCISQTFTHDSIAPSLPTMTLLSAASPSKNASPVFRISGLVAPDSYQIYTDGTCTTTLESGIAISSDKFLNPTFSANGIFPIFINLTDPANNSTGCSGPLLTYIYDTLPPTVTARQVGGAVMPSGGTNNQIWNFEAIMSIDATFYKYKVGESATTDCGVATGYSAWQAPSTVMAVDLSADGDGTKKICIYAKDGAGNESLVSTYSWSQVTSSPIAEFSGVPVSPSKTVNLAIDVTDTGLVSYRYKVGATGSTDCANSTGYSASDIVVTTNITENISAVPDGSVTLCVVGKNSGGVEQPYALASSATWVKDTVGPSLKTPVMAGITWPSNDQYYSGDHWSITAEFNEDVQVVGAALVKALVGGSAKDFSFIQQINSKTLKFDYMLNGGEAGQFGFQTSLNIPAGTVADLAGNLVVTQSVTSGYKTGVVSNATIPTYSFSVSSQSVSEAAGSVTITINSSAAISINNLIEISLEPQAPAGVTAVPQAIPGVDFTFSSQEILFPAGQTTATFNIPIINDAETEAAVERFILQLKGTDRGEVSSSLPTLQQILIRDDENDDSDADRLVEIDSNGYASCFITVNDSLYCLGTNTNYATFGNTQTGYTRSATKVASNIQKVYRRTNNLFQKTDGSFLVFPSTALNTPANVVSVFKSITGYCFVTNLDQTYCTGSTTYDTPVASGPSTVNVQPVATPVINGLKDLKVAGGTACALGDFDLNPATHDTLKCWGNNSYSTIGKGNAVATPIVFEHSSLGHVKGIVGAGATFCAWGDFDLNPGTGDTVACWGHNFYNQSGVVATADVTTPNLISGLENVNQVFVISNGLTFCALGDFDSGTNGNEVRCWGYNYYSNLGNGLIVNYSATPVSPTGLTDVINLYSHYFGFCAERADHSIYCWGSGFGTTPVLQVGITGPFQKVSASQNGSGICFLSSTGNLGCSGGIALTKTGVSDVEVSNNKICYIQSGKLTCSSSFSAGETVISSTLGSQAPTLFTSSTIEKFSDKSNCLKPTGKENWYCGGSNGSNYKYLMNSTTGSLLSFVKTKIKNLSTISNVNYSSCGLSDGQSLLCWGGYISFGATTLKDPRIMAANVEQFAISEFRSTSGVNGTFINGKDIYQWYQSSISTVSGFSGGATAVSAGWQFFCAIEFDSPNKVKCWGSNNSGASNLGNGDIVSGIVATPVEVTGVSNATKIATGHYTSCAIKADKSMMCWGHGGGMLPFDVGVADVDDVKITQGDKVCIRTSNGYISCTASAFSGAPVFTAAVDDAVDFWIPGNNICAKKSNGNILCWGATPSTFGRFYDYDFLSYY